MNNTDAFSSQLEELSKLELRQEYAKAALIYIQLYDTELQHNSKFILKYSLFLEKNKAYEKSLTVINTFLQSKPKLEKSEREQFDKRIAQLSNRIGIQPEVSNDNQTLKTKVKNRILNAPPRDIAISVVLLVILVGMAIFSTVYKETYDAKLLETNMNDFVSDSALQESENNLPSISDESIKTAQKLLDDNNAISRSKIIISRGIIGIAAEISPNSDELDARKAVESALKVIADMNQGGDYHLRGPTANNYGGLFDYYNALSILTNSSHKPLSTGIKVRVDSKLQWESN